MKRFALASVSVYIVLAVFEWIFHGIILKDAYEATADAWRSPSDMTDNYPILIIVQIIFVLFITFLFTRNYENKGLGEGLRYGLYVGAFMALLHASFYPFVDVPLSLGTAWVLGSLIEGVLLGITLSFTYKK